MADDSKAKEIKERAGRFCAFRERSPHELKEKLASWGVSENDQENILSELKEEGFVNEQRFANAYCHDKFEFNSWGKQKIRSGIFIHKLPESVVENALDSIDMFNYASRLENLAKKKWGKLEKEQPIKKKQKTVAYLASKGFELELIWKTINSLEKEGL